MNWAACSSSHSSEHVVQTFLVKKPSTLSCQDNWKTFLGGFAPILLTDKFRSCQVGGRDSIALPGIQHVRACSSRIFVLVFEFHTSGQKFGPPNSVKGPPNRILHQLGLELLRRLGLGRLRSTLVLASCPRPIFDLPQICRGAIFGKRLSAFQPGLAQLRPCARTACTGTTRQALERDSETCLSTNIQNLSV